MISIDLFNFRKYFLFSYFFIFKNNFKNAILLLMYRTLKKKMRVCGVWNIFTFLRIWLLECKISIFGIWLTTIATIANGAAVVARPPPLNYCCCRQPIWSRVFLKKYTIVLGILVSTKYKNDLFLRI